MIYICLCFALLYLAFLLEPNGIRVERTREYVSWPAKAQPRLYADVVSSNIELDQEFVRLVRLRILVP